jgi:hypothetical protein
LAIPLDLREDEDALKAKLHKRLAITVDGLHKNDIGGSSGVMFG